MYRLFPQLTTQRLFLRQIVPQDAEALFALFSDETVTRYLDIAAMERPRQAHHLIKIMTERFDSRQGIRWAMVLKENQQIIGTCGYNHWGFPPQSQRAEIGYDMACRYWGQGLMKEALNKIIHYGFTIKDLNRIEALVLPENTRSINLLQNLGFQKEGFLREYAYFKAQFWSLYCYGLLQSEWVREGNG
jgi:ribosomal-protein-alanine N-acetyltransferase